MFRNRTTNQQLLEEINHKLGVLMAAQDDINNAIAGVTAIVTDLQTDATTVQGYVASLVTDLAAWVAAQPATVDTSGLAPLVTAGQAAQAAVDAQVAALGTQVAGLNAKAAPPAA